MALEQNTPNASADQVPEAELSSHRLSWRRPVVTRIDVGRLTLTKCTSNCAPC